MALVGCSGWGGHRDGSIDYHTVTTQQPSILTLTPERRTVLVVPSDFNGANSGLRTCPEPPPDVAEALTTAMALGLRAHGKTGAETALNLSQSFNSSIAQLYYRTQGAQLFRDGSHVLCLAWLNDIYKTNDLQAWRTDLRYLLDVSKQLIQEEVASQAHTRRQLEGTTPALRDDMPAAAASDGADPADAPAVANPGKAQHGTIRDGKAGFDGRDASLPSPAGGNDAPDAK